MTKALLAWMIVFGATVGSEAVTRPEVSVRFPAFIILRAPHSSAEILVTHGVVPMVRFGAKLIPDVSESPIAVLYGSLRSTTPHSDAYAGGVVLEVAEFMESRWQAIVDSNGVPREKVTFDLSAQRSSIYWNSDSSALVWDAPAVQPVTESTRTLTIGPEGVAILRELGALGLTKSTRP